MSDQDSTAEPQAPGAGAHQGPGRWARRGAERMGMPTGEVGPEHDGPFEPPTADSGDPDISPSLAGGHAGATHRDSG